MPRAFLKTKNRGGHKTYRCSFPGCKSTEIRPGDQYYTWKFNHGARFFQHAEHGPPRRSQLTQSKMGPVWDAVDSFDVSGAESIDDIKSELESVAAAAREVASEYEDAANNIEGSWPAGNPTSEACRSTSEALDGWADDLEGWTPDYDEFDKEAFDTKEDWLEECRQSATDMMADAPEYQG
jgi:hypothetical protein